MGEMIALKALEEQGQQGHNPYDIINILKHEAIRWGKGFRAKNGGGRKKMNKADKIRLNQRWIREAEEKINVLKEEIAVYAIDIKAYQNAISSVEEEEE